MINYMLFIKSAYIKIVKIFVLNLEVENSP